MVGAPRKLAGTDIMNRESDLMLPSGRDQRLLDISPELERLLTRGESSPPPFGATEVRSETVWVHMRDGARMATDIYRPPLASAPAICVRTPYGRAADRLVGALVSFARRGFVVVSQDCRGTGDSEPDRWDYYMYETEDGLDFVSWVSTQKWFDGFLGSCGGSYVGQTQWCMAMHQGMTTIVPEVSGLGIASNTAHLYMALNAYARSVGKGSGKVAIHYRELERLIHEETLAGGYFNEPLHKPFSDDLLAVYPELKKLGPLEAKRWLWELYCSLSCAERAVFVQRALGTRNVTALDVESLSELFGQEISHDALTVPHVSPPELCKLLRAPALMITGWYDWALNDAIATWEMIRAESNDGVRERSRLIITPAAHNVPGYHEGMAEHPELRSDHRTPSQVGLLVHWYSSLKAGSEAAWPRVIYYLMGANEWRVASDWPPPESHQLSLYLQAGNALSRESPPQESPPDSYIYDPNDPFPTVGGSVVSAVYPPGSVDLGEVQRRPDVLVYTTERLSRSLDVVGPLRLVVYASSSAVDTDFSVRLSDVFPDGRAVLIQSGILRARHRNLPGEPELLEPLHIYCLEIDMWATANRFKAGHCLRIDISSADFPRFDRNTNLGGKEGDPVCATQKIYHDSGHPSRLILSVIDGWE